MHAARVLAASLTLLACRPGPTPCNSPGTCPAGTECLANRCVPEGGDPVPSATRRLVLRPTTLVLVTDRSRTASLPGAVVFGSRVEGDAALYLEFEPMWRNPLRLESAFLLLSPQDGTQPSVQDIPVEVWRIAIPWRPSSLTYLDQPAREPPMARGLARSSPATTLRIDVTEIVRHWADHPYEDHGIVLVAAPGPGHGAAFATGASGGVGPRLELYTYAR